MSSALSSLEMFLGQKRKWRCFLTFIFPPPIFFFVCVCVCVCVCVQYCLITCEYANNRTTAAYLLLLYLIITQTLIFYLFFVSLLILSCSYLLLFPCFSSPFSGLFFLSTVFGLFIWSIFFFISNFVCCLSRYSYLTHLYHFCSKLQIIITRKFFGLNEIIVVLLIENIKSVWLF